MNQRKAGEDFYFLHKFSILDQLGEINVEIVLPLARSSDRVPFGTGKAISQIIQGKNGPLTMKKQFNYLFKPANGFLLKKILS